MLLKSISLIIVILLPSFVSAATIEDDSKVQSQCKKISDRLASLSYKRCLSHNYEITGGRSVKGSPILAKSFYTAPNKNVSDKNETEEITLKRILLVGGIHGNEYASVSVIFKWITLLNKHYPGSYDWQIVPLLNPDGLLQRSSKRTNANGVDLDSNFPTSDSDYNAIQYWEENTNRDPEYFPGDHALSEPESQWLAEEIEQYLPDAIIAIHAPHNSLIYGSSGTKQSKNAAQYQQSIATNPGSFNEFVGTEMNIPILTVELAYSEIMPSKTEINEIWKDLLKWLNMNIESS
jgi:murein tripeptide amidase MpaA